MHLQKKILIIRNDHIGDLVLSSAIFREIKKKIPNSKISLIVSKLNRQLVEKNKNVDEIIELERAEYKLKTFWNFLKMSKKIKKMNFDAGIDLRGSIMNSFFLLYLPGIKKRISRVDSHPVISPLLTNPIGINPSTHATKDNLKIINEGLEIDAKNEKLEIITDKEDQKIFNFFINKNKLKKYVCICPYAGLKCKQWPLEEWKSLIRWFKKYDYDIILLGIKKDKTGLKKLAEENKNCRVILDLNLRLMYLLFKKSSLIITQDGGPMHIAWVSGAKLIELHNLFLYGMNKVIPIKNSKIIYTRNISMSSINIEEVKKTIEKILKN